MAALAVVVILLVRDAAGLPAHRRLPIRRRLLRCSAILIVLGASALFNAVAVTVAVADGSNPEAAGRTLAAAGFLLWLAGVALLLLAVTADRFRAASRLAAQLVEAAVAAVF